MSYRLTPFRMVFGLEVVIPMEFVVPFLRAASSTVNNIRTVVRVSREARDFDVLHHANYPLHTSSKSCISSPRPSGYDYTKARAKVFGGRLYRQWGGKYPTYPPSFPRRGSTSFYLWIAMDQSCLTACGPQSTRYFQSLSSRPRSEEQYGLPYLGGRGAIKVVLWPGLANMPSWLLSGMDEQRFFNFFRVTPTKTTQRHAHKTSPTLGKIQCWVGWKYPTTNQRP